MLVHSNLKVNIITIKTIGIQISTSKDEILGKIVVPQYIEVEIATAEGPSLDWLVATCQELVITIDSNPSGYYPITFSEKLGEYFAPSTNPVDAWPIIDHEGILVGPSPFPQGEFAACIGNEWNTGKFIQCGSTGLIAAMRCYTTSKLGKTARIPTWLLIA